MNIEIMRKHFYFLKVGNSTQDKEFPVEERQLQGFKLMLKGSGGLFCPGTSAML